MRLNHLSPAEMLSLSRPLLDPQHPAHQALKLAPEAFALSDRLQSAHDKLLNRQQQDDLSAQLLQRELLELKSTYDGIVRGTDSLCASCEVLSEEEEQRSAWQRIRKQILPDGLNMMNQSYSSAGGHALLLKKRMESVSAADKKLLRSQQLGRRSAHDLVLRLVDVGLLIGSKEQERQSLMAGPSPAEIFAARQQWARTMGAMLSLIELSEPNAEIEQHLLSPLRAVVARAGRRRKIEEPKPEPMPVAVLAPVSPPEPHDAAKAE